MQTSYFKMLLLVTALLIAVFPTNGQEGSDTTSVEDMYSMSLEDLMEMEVKVASKSKSSLRESPGIISVISAEQIQKMGARDLIDVLRMVPGFQFGVDVEGIIGVGIRGNWAHEGKMSLQIDGQEINETLFSTTQFGRHFPVDNIKRIEIIRGPGSALYGGYAELGVVNIITRNAADVDGVAFSANVSEMEKTYGQRNMTLSYGQTVNDLDVSLHTFLGTANRSDGEYTGFNADYDDFETYDMTDNSRLNTMHVNLGISKGNFKNRLIVDRYHTQVKDGFEVVTGKFNVDYNSIIFNSEYEFDATDKLTIIPSFTYKKQQPWHNVNQKSKDPFYFLNVETERITGRITGKYNASEKLNFIGGFELYQDMAVAPDSFDYLMPDNPEDSMQAKVSYMNYAAFLQGELKTQYVNILAGIRFEDNNAYSSSIVPRVALTKAFDKFHFKALASQAFRAPGISNINTNEVLIDAGVSGVTPIKPEKTTVFELELGYKISSSMFVAANLFDITMDQPIVYHWNESLAVEGYQNYDQTGSRGIEVDLRYSEQWGNINLTYSHYMQGGKNKVAAYEVPDNFDNEALLGLSRNKVTLFTSFNITENLSLSPSMVFNDKKYGWAPETNDDGEIVWDVNKEFDPNILVNFFISYNNLFVDNLSLGAGVYNILDEDIQYVQPYMEMWHAPLPGASREFMVKLGYNIMN